MNVIDGQPVVVYFKIIIIIRLINIRLYQVDLLIVGLLMLLLFGIG